MDKEWTQENKHLPGYENNNVNIDTALTKEKFSLHILENNRYLGNENMRFTAHYAFASLQNYLIRTTLRDQFGELDHEFNRHK